MKKQQNIILIVMDATRPQNLGCYGYEKPTSPCIDQIAKENIRFTQAFATSNCTMPSLVSMNTGLHPLQHGVIHIGLPHQNPEFLNLAKLKIWTLPALLKKNGYETGAIDWLGGYLRNGYDYYSGVIQDTKVYDNAVNTTNVAIKFIENAINKTERGLTDTRKDLLRSGKKKQKSPFFLFLHYWDTHDPYKKGNIDTKPFQTELAGVTVSEVRPKLLQLKDKDVNLVKADYDAAIRNVDTQIGRLFEYLDDNKLLNNTTVIITADHGESLGEHDIWFTHYGIYDVTIHIPLIIYTPSRVNYIDRELALHQDFYPTILNLAGIPQNCQYFYGHDIIGKPRQSIRIRKNPLVALEAAGHDCEAIRFPLWKLTGIPRQRDGEHWDKKITPSTTPKLFDLKKDPEETDNVTEKFPVITQKLQEQLDEQIRNIKETFTNARNP